MSDVELDITNEAHEATEIAAQDDFSESYVFQANATTGPAGANIDGLKGLGTGTGTGVIGIAPGTGVIGEGTIGCLGRGPTGATAFAGVGGLGVFGCAGTAPVGTTALAGVSGQGFFGVDARGKLAGVFAEGEILGVIANGTLFGSIGVDATGLGAGVVGQSSTGMGIHGKSIEDRGGVFESEQIAQLRLVPSTNIRVPLHGHIGDFFVHLGRLASAGEGATLFFCVNENPVQWRPVELGSVIAGGEIAP